MGRGRWKWKGRFRLSGFLKSENCFLEKYRTLYFTFCYCLFEKPVARCASKPPSPPPPRIAFPRRFPHSASGRRTPSPLAEPLASWPMGALEKSKRGPWKNRIEFPHTERQEGHVPRSVSSASSNKCNLSVKRMKLKGMKR